MKLKLPKIIPIFPLSGIIFFPKTNLPLNIFEPRYLSLVEDSFNSNKYMGMIQTKKIVQKHTLLDVLEKLLRAKKLKMVVY